MLCLKKKKFWGSSSSYGPQSQSKSFGLDQGNGIASDDGKRRVSRENSRARDMAPPPSATQAVHPVVREVTEDTPPDLLEGTMDLLVVLPSGKTVQTTVDRKTPMMDLLIHTATANKINPAGHIVQVRNERGIEMPYKPSTPIGALDTTTIEIVPKNRVNEYIIVKKPTKVANQPFETTFRLQVHLPRNQLYVIRISPKALLDDILREVCQEKNLDISKYEIRHPVNLDQKLPLSATVGETGLQELTVVSKNSKINSSVSTADIIALQSEDCRGKGCLDGSFKHSRSSVGDSSVSSESTASGSGRGISPCRSEDSRSISPLPLIRPKTLFHSRTTSNISTASSGNSSGVHMKGNALNSSVSSQISHQQVVMQAPPRTKKRAAPKPPSTPESRANSINSSISEKTPTCGTPLSDIPNNATRANGTPLERPTPRKKEAPREPPKPHPHLPLSHHQSLPINHSRHLSGSVDHCHQPEVASPFQQNQNDLTHLDSAPNSASTSKMSNKHSHSSSMTNLTSVSSVSSTSLASSTGGASKKRRAPKPPVLATLNPPTQIEEETTTTDSETSTLRSRDVRTAKESNIADKESVQVGKRGVLPDHTRQAEVHRVSPVSSLSSPSTSTSSSPVPPATEFSSKSKNTSSSVMKGQRSGNTNKDAGEGRRDEEHLDESGSSISRSSRTPSSSNIDNNLVAPASPDPVRSRKVPSSNAVDVEETVTSSRPPSSNTQVSSQGMPMPVPRRRVSPTTYSASNKSHSESQEDTTTEMPLPKPKPRPRSDRKSMDSNISSHQGKSLSTESDDSSRGTSFDTNVAVAPPPPMHSAQLKNPLSKYGVKVLPDNVLKERAERLKKQTSMQSDTASDAETTTTSPAHKNYALKADAQSHRNPSTTTKVPIQQASKSFSSSSDTTGEYSDTGSLTILPPNKIHTGKSGLPPKPVPTPSKFDYTSQGSVRSLKQLTSAAEKGNHNNKEGGYESDDLEENLDFFEPVHRHSTKHNKAIPPKPAAVEKRPLIKSVSSQSAPTFPPSPRISKEENKAEVAVAAPPAKPRVLSSVSAYEERKNVGKNPISPGAKSDFGFSQMTSHHKEKAVEEDEAKLNRWQNMVSLNEIESANQAGQTGKNPAGGKRPVVSTRSLGSTKPTFLHGDYQRTNNPSEESQNEATCHSSESEASYTDSGVPATETVTPSPVNLDDVILDQEYHPGSHPDKFSSEDGDERKHSSRRSSIQSDHSEEWMNILEAKMNKDEESIEKMFEAVLPKEESLSSDNQKGVRNENVRYGADSKSPSHERNKERDTSLEMDYSNEEDKDSETDERNELIETTAQLHQAPEKEESIEVEQEDKLSASITNPSADAVPVRKLSNSQSFSHNSEFDEAKEKRKNFHTGRSNAIQRSSGGSAIDLRNDETLSDSEDELAGINEMEKMANNVDSMQQHNHARDDRAVSMNDLSSGDDYNGLSADAAHIEDKKSAEYQATPMHKSASLQKFPEQQNKDESVDVIRKQLEMQFEQWKEEFMKKQSKPEDELNDHPISTKTEQADQSTGQEVEEAKLNDNDSGDDESIKLNADNAHQVTQVEESFAEKTVVDEPEVETFSTEREKLAQSPLPSERETVVEPQEKAVESAEASHMNQTEDYPVVLRKKEVKSIPPVVYQYAGPPTIKMSAWNEGPRRQVTVKKDEDYIMGFGQQDPNAKSANPTRIHSFHGGPVVPITQPQTDNKLKRESSPSPNPTVKGWSVVLNAPNIMPGSTGAVRSVLSTWKQKMEETEKEKTKPKQGPPAEIDIYGTEHNTDGQVPTKPTTKTVTNGVVNKDNANNAPSTEKTVIGKAFPPTTNGNIIIKQADPKPTNTPPKLAEKSMTLGSSFRTDKPVIFTMSHMDSNTMPRNKPSSVKPSPDAVDSKPKPPASPTVEVTNSGSLQDKKKFFQGIKPVENGKEAPIPAANMKSNIASIQKVFEKQRVTKMQQMGSQQSLYSDGTTSPVSGLQRNDSLESRQSINTLQRQNSIESHSSDSSSSVVLRVSQNSSGKASPQLSGNEMVQKLFGRPNSYNMDISRRTPSPISSTTSTLSSSASHDRFTPSPTVTDGPNNSVRITTGGYRPPSNQSPNIRSVGNKAIIIVNGDAKSAGKDQLSMRKDMTAANDNIVLEGKSNKNVIKKSSSISTFVSAINQQQQQAQREPIVQVKRESAVLNKREPIVQNKRDCFVDNKRETVVLNKRESIVSPPPKQAFNEPMIIEKNARNVQSNGVPPPPPPPPADGIMNMKPSLSLDVKRASIASNNTSNSKPVTPSSPSSPDPRAEINNAIKNSNGNFGLRKTGSSILLK